MVGIDGWYIDAEGQRWNFHGDPSVAQDLLHSNVALDSMGDGTYTLTVTGEPLALKAAHAETCHIKSGNFISQMAAAMLKAASDI